MSVKIFVTGTDTDVGKTYHTVALLNALNQLGFKTIGMKPVASGAYYENGRYYNEDARRIQQASSITLDYDLINSFLFKQPIAPHLAAQQNGIQLTLNNLISKVDSTMSLPCDIHLIEGAGGWLVPLNQKETMADFVKHYQMQVVLVVRMRLGCINHALLTYHAIKSAGLKTIGWIANCIDPEIQEVDKMVETLNDMLAVPLLVKVSFSADPQHYYDLTPLLQNRCITR